MKQEMKEMKEMKERGWKGGGLEQSANCFESPITYHSLAPPLRPLLGTPTLPSRCVGERGRRCGDDRRGAAAAPHALAAFHGSPPRTWER